MDVRAIAFYLPQYHPIQENDEWWGKGFTEWRNVTRARPLFPGHHQPQLPGELGFYDLRCEDTRIAQAELAREHGIFGFCYYHYWFSGQMLLARPFNEVLASGRPDFPFCLCWANENWTRAWDGSDRQILMEQTYDESSIQAHITWLCRAFRDPRYIRVRGRPLILIYRTDILPNVAGLLRTWRAQAQAEGFPELYIAAVLSNFPQLGEQELIALGFDATVEFQPRRDDVPHLSARERRLLRLKERYNRLRARTTLTFLPEARLYSRFDYGELAENAMARAASVGHVRFPCVSPGWDNTARRREPVILQNDDPVVYERWLRFTAERARSRDPEERIVFINAWNEWAEGCHLEPDLRSGRQFLEATRRALVG
jgi:lipopolysaccharide biosynthesis protein